MLKIIVGVWIYLCGLVGALVTGGMLALVLSVYPPSHIQTYGPHVPAVARSWSVLLPYTPVLLWLSAAASAVAGLVAVTVSA
jgi:hypothetical protein